MVTIDSWHHERSTGYRLARSVDMYRRMTNKERTIAKRNAIAMVGSAVFHKGEHGVIEAYADDYAEPMLRVRFGTRIATLKPTEIGA